MKSFPALSHSALSLEQIVDALPEQIAYWDKDLICRYANRAYLEWFSQTAEAVLGLSMRDLLGPVLFEKNRACLQGIARGEPQSFVRSYPQGDGRVVKVHVKYVPNFGADGEVVGFYSSINDVTAFQAIEDQLREKEAELLALVARREEAISWLKMAEETAHVGHWRLCLPTGALTWSDEMYRIHGVTPECYVPEMETALSFYYFEDRVRVQALMQQALSQGTQYEDTRRLVRRDGEVRYVRTRGMAAPGPAGPTMMFGVFVDITDQQKTEQALRVARDRLDAIAHLDGLTGISNRRRFDEAFDGAARAAARGGPALSLVLIDVDHFKAFNDTYGHQSGDACLRAVAEAVQGVARPQDLVARYGGEEFAMVLPATDRAQATLIAEQARAAVEGLGKRHKGSALGRLTISAGVASIHANPSRRPTPEPRTLQQQLIAEADTMLYRAKNNGRNQVVAAADRAKATA